MRRFLFRNWKVHIQFRPGSHDCRRKGCKTKKHEKRIVFHAFLLFKHRKRAFMKSEVKIIFYGCFFADYQKTGFELPAMVIGMKEE